MFENKKLEKELAELRRIEENRRLQAQNITRIEQLEKQVSRLTEENDYLRKNVSNEAKALFEKEVRSLLVKYSSAPPQIVSSLDCYQQRGYIQYYV